MGVCKPLAIIANALTSPQRGEEEAGAYSLVAGRNRLGVGFACLGTAPGNVRPCRGDGGEIGGSKIAMESVGDELLSAATLPGSIGI
jgi:hypothetical protein